MSNVGCGLVALAAAAVVPLVGYGVVGWYQGFDYGRRCDVYLDRAAHAPTIDVAAEALDKAVAYLDENHMTSGNTGVLWTVPQNDVGYWYERLKTARADLDAAKKTAGPNQTLTESNVLMKLRETIVQGGAPEGIAYFPHNVAWCLGDWCAGLIGLGALVVGFIGFVMWTED